MVITTNQAKIENKQQYYHSLRTQASLENRNNNNTIIAFTTIINLREHIFRHKAKALRCRHHLTRVSSSRNQIGLIFHGVCRRWNMAKVVMVECWNARKREGVSHWLKMESARRGRRTERQRDGKNDGRDNENGECEKRKKERMPETTMKRWRQRNNARTTTRKWEG